jgi:hypothetical protein
VEPEPRDLPAAERPPATPASSLIVQLSGLLVFVGAVVAVALGPFAVEAQEGYCGNQDHPGPCPEVEGFVVAGLVIALPGLWGLVVAYNLRHRRPWARTAAVATYGLCAAATIVGAAATLVGPDEPAWGGALAFLLALSVFARIVGLTLREHGTD